MLRIYPALLLTLLLVLGCANNFKEAPEVRLYAMDCGTMEFFDISSFSVEGKFNGQATTLVNPCFLVRHPAGDLLWDVGLQEDLVDNPEGIKSELLHMTMKTRLTEQLRQLDLTPTDIEYLSISHSHPDHVGNGGSFTDSTFIINELEYSYMFSEERRADPTYFPEYAGLETSKTLPFTAEHDVFGDGSVVIKGMPGHTPGHSVLLLRLEKAGSILLTGDLYIFQGSRDEKAIPAFNIDAEATAASIDRFEALAAQEQARVVIQHDKKHFESLPVFPEFLD